jgi:5'-nucleotidase
MLAKTYQWILFDADDTLFHFDAFSGLQLAFSRFDFDFTAQHYQEYQILNKSLWIDYQEGKITIQQLQINRFGRWADKIGISSQVLSKAFLAAMMTEICMPIEGAINLLNTVKDKVKLGIITNGFTELQEARLERTGLKNYFDFLITSEEVGVAKPHQGIFDHALSMMGNPPRENVLMVGDNLESDILGGINAGFDTCWVNINNQLLLESNIKPHYEISALKELNDLLLDKLTSL